MYIIIIYLHDTIARYMLQLNLLISIVAIKCHFDYFPFCEILKLIESLLQYLEYLFFTSFFVIYVEKNVKECHNLQCTKFFNFHNAIHLCL